MAKARQFWITDNTDNSGFSVETKFNNNRHFGSCNVFHVIEYSAYQKAIEALRKVVKNIPGNEGSPVYNCEWYNNKMEAKRILEELGEME